MKPILLVFICLIVFCETMKIRSKNFNNVNDLPTQKYFRRNFLDKLNSRTANCSTCSYGIFVDKKAKVQQEKAFYDDSKRRISKIPKVTENPEISPNSNFKSTFHARKSKSLKLPSAFFKRRRSYYKLSKIHFHTKRNSKNIRRRFNSKNSFIDPALYDNKNTTKTRIVRRESEKSYSIQTTTKATYGENVYETPATDPTDTISNMQQTTLDKDIETTPSYVKTRDVDDTEEESSYEKLDKLLKILKQQLKEEYADIENGTQLNNTDETTTYSEVVTSTINSTIAEAIVAEKRVKLVFESLIGVVSFLVIIAVIFQCYSVLLKYYEYLVYTQATDPVERVSFFKFCFNRHRITHERHWKVESEMLEPKLKENRDVLMESVEKTLDRLCLESDYQLEQKYSHPEHVELLKRQLYSTSS